MSEENYDGGNEERSGLYTSRRFSVEGKDPFYTDWDGNDLSYKLSVAEVLDKDGKPVFRQENVETPESWSLNSTNIIASKYFYGDEGKDEERESSSRQVFGRISKFISERGLEQGYFSSREEAEIFRDDLSVLMTNQAGAFNSPTLFNAGIYHEYGVESGSKGHYRWDFDSGNVVEMQEGEAYKYPQISACFIVGVKDDMNAIMDVAKQQAMLFKGGSGCGVDLSPLRSSREKLQGGGSPSGPLSFGKIYNSVADVVQSGGKTRRAAEMQSLLVHHPDIREFIEAKKRQEELAHVLIDGGVDGSFGGEAYASVNLQNANLSVRATDEFMRSVVNNSPWQTVPVYNEELSDQMPRWNSGKELLDLIAEGTHICGDPGMQFHTTINRWNTCPNDFEIMASNPCSEYMFVNDSACNLASLNLMKYKTSEGEIDVSKLKNAVRSFIISQDILVDSAGYPSEKVAKNSHDYRPLGLGYANLGALVSSLGIPYDSDKGRALASSVTAIITGTAYLTSSEIAEKKGSFERFENNKSPMMEVMRSHRSALEDISLDSLGENYSGLFEEAKNIWDSVVEKGEELGFRNAQTTVLAPTGTIGFLMGCDTTGIEPEIALVSYKSLVGGGQMKLVNGVTSQALERLNYSPDQIEDIVSFIYKNDTIEGAPHLKEEHLPVFDCSFKPAKGERSIDYMGHLKMMSAVQPFLSGAISKTVNMPKESTLEDIADVYVNAWKMGLKAVAIYRDGSKRTQPLRTDSGKEEQTLEGRLGRTPPERLKLPRTCPSIRHKFEVGTFGGNHSTYLHLGMYDDGSLGELFLTSGDEGSEVRGMADGWATAFSLLLQDGHDLRDLVNKFSVMSFPPSGTLSGGGKKGVLDNGRINPLSTKSLIAYSMNYIKDNFFDEDGNECAYIPYKKMGLFGGMEEKEKQEEISSSEEGDLTREELMKQVNMSCPKCGGNAIKRGKCDSFCVDEMVLYPGSCGGE